MSDVSISLNMAAGRVPIATSFAQAEKPSALGEGDGSNPFDVMGLRRPSAPGPQGSDSAETSMPGCKRRSVREAIRENLPPVSAYSPTPAFAPIAATGTANADLGKALEGLTGATQLAALMLQFQQMVADVSLTQMSQTSAFLTTMLDKQRQESLECAKKASEQLERAARSQKILGWVCKLLTWVMTIVSVVSAVFTGGASLAIAVAMASVTIADQIVEATTGTSPIASAVNAVFTPIVAKLGEQISKALEALGVPKEVAEIVAQVLATIFVIVGVVVMALVGRAAFNALSKQIGPLVSGLMERASASVARGMPEGLRTLGTRASAGFKALGNEALQRIYGDSDKIAAAALQWQRAAIATQVITPTAAAASGVVVASMNREATIAQSSYQQLDASSRMLEDVLEKAVGTYSTSLKKMTAMIAAASEAMSQERQVCLDIAIGKFRAA